MEPQIYLQGEFDRLLSEARHRARKAECPSIHVLALDANPWWVPNVTHALQPALADQYGCRARVTDELQALCALETSTLQLCAEVQSLIDREENQDAPQIRDEQTAAAALEQLSILISDLEQNSEESLTKTEAQWLHGRIQMLAFKLTIQLRTFGEALHKGEQLRALSEDQKFVVECPRSIFVQGRSGTGKTMCIAQRICFMRSQKQRSRRLFITRSQMLCSNFVAELGKLGVATSRNAFDLPAASNEAVVCLTWDEWVRHLAPQLGQPITYDIFLHQYWPKLTHNSCDLDPVLVWTEFHNTLRSFSATPKLTGAPMSLEDYRGHQLAVRAGHALSLDEYLLDNTAAVGITLTEEEQRSIYSMFIQYLQLKLAQQTSKAAKVQNPDGTDVASAVKDSTAVSLIDELYVDEAQDFSPAELASLMGLCGNPDGVTIVGDTCQTINPGSAFSFREVMSAFRAQTPKPNPPPSEAFPSPSDCGLAILRRALSGESNASAPTQANLGAIMLKRHLSASFEDDFKNRAAQCCMASLRRNYRSAAQIVELANSLSSLLMEAFPASVDAIEEEPIASTGLPPAFVSADLRKVVMGTESLKLERLDERTTAIIVRDPAARNRLRSAGVQGVILTVAESKGLEFDFVVLCDFFRAPRCPERTWAVAKHGAKQIKTPEAIFELKCLYTAITRARSGVALVESEAKGSGPAFQVWGPMLQRWCQKSLITAWIGLRTYLNAAARELSGDHEGATSLSHLIPEEPEEPQDYPVMVTVLNLIGTSLLGPMELQSSTTINDLVDLVAPTIFLPSAESLELRDLEDALRWILEESRAREGKEYKAARKALAVERSRLLSKGDFDAGFRERFACDYGNLMCNQFRAETLQAQESQRVGLIVGEERLRGMDTLGSFGSDALTFTAIIEDANIPPPPPRPEPAVVPISTMLSRRAQKQQELLPIAKSIWVGIAERQMRGDSLFHHAFDNIEERWQVFGEAYGVFQGCVQDLDQLLEDQLRNRSMRSVVPNSSVSNGNLEDVTWRRAISTIVAGQLSRRQIPLHKINDPRIWEAIFAACAPRGLIDADAVGAIRLTVERTLEHSSTRSPIQRKALLSRAWYLCGSALHDAKSLGREAVAADETKEALREEKLHRNMCKGLMKELKDAHDFREHAQIRELENKLRREERSAADALQKAQECFAVKLVPAVGKRVLSLSEAGKLFDNLGEILNAAETYEHLASIVTKFQSDWSELADTLTVSTRCEFENLMVCGRSGAYAAALALLVPVGNIEIQAESEDLLTRAASCFQQAGKAREAAICLCKSVGPPAALSVISELGGVECRTRGLVLACALLLHGR